MVRRLGLGKNNHLTYMYASLALNPRYAVGTHLSIPCVSIEVESATSTKDNASILGFYIQLTLIISTSLILNNCLSRSENLVPA